ncbi:LOW QUALITY PROTEIN: uncharacterized protein LOC123208884 [Mangifera indica]|uniref:LOW QUALITY PROTEIN: uncharacterized protein LOC123208884 n=1 Tax=Mangifera indica TaxID=29780 RepID=UPI001CFAA3D9|nr:LOW QUALITY PROTEIN: uncharacterized protein LOC123208884 [Mangifera indica]
MGRGGKVNSRGDVKRRVRSKDKGSDDSDEDYVVSDEGNDVSEDELEDYCSSVDGYESEESFGAFVEEEEEEVEEETEVRKIIGSKARKSSLGNGDKTSRKRKRVLYGDEEDEEYEGEEEEEEDEEFTPDEDDSLDDEEELVVMKKKKNSRKNQKLGRKGLRKKGSVRGQKRKNRTASAKPLGKKGRTRGFRKKERCYDDEDGDFLDDAPVLREKSKTKSSRRRRKYVVPSDSDFVSSGSSDYDYTISEEEREQMREANELCGNLKTSLRSSFSSKKIEEEDILQERRKPPVRKGKEKIEVVKSEVAKQVCGICLSEEDKRRFRGTLNCCSHYFCFACIMEWSKVESRCPLCKQRFKTITKPERATAGVDLRSVVIPVPKRDQVYQPSEEDLRSYLDPYENVICSECRQGGDDGLMLLCDICDSSAHTYCVGLGWVVPEGNWYCDGCRLVDPGSSSSLAQDPLPDQRTTNNNLFSRPSPISSFGEILDPPLSSPRIPLTQSSVNLSSPRISVGDLQAASPGPGAGAPTLSGRRWRHRQIQNLLSINRMNFMAGSADGMSTPNLSSDFLNSRIDQGRETVVQPASAPGNTELLRQTIIEERLPEYPSSLVENSEIFASRLSHLRRQAVQDPNMTTMNRPANLTLWPELAGINSIPSYEQFRQCSSISNIGSDSGLSPFAARDEGDFYVAKEQLQSIVKSHLKNLSRDIELDHSTFKDIARSSTHTILATCGLEHRRSEVHLVHPPSICSHVERLAAGQTSLMKGFCSSCFDTFVKDVVKKIMDTRMPQWLSLGL